MYFIFLYGQDCWIHRFFGYCEKNKWLHTHDIITDINYLKSCKTSMYLYAEIWQYESKFLKVYKHYICFFSETQKGEKKNFWIYHVKSCISRNKSFFTIKTPFSMFTLVRQNSTLSKIDIKKHICKWKYWILSFYIRTYIWSLYKKKQYIAILMKDVKIHVYFTEINPNIMHESALNVCFKFTICCQKFPCSNFLVFFVLNSQKIV